MSTLKVFLITQIVLISAIVSGCLVDLTGTESGTSVVSDPSETPPTQPLTEPAKTICDPFATNSPQGRDRGLVGNLLYLTDDQPRYGQVSDYITNGSIAPATIYLDRLYIPTRPFDRGFITQTGQLVETSNNNTLYEYFALRMDSQLQLGANEAPGLYQLALMADDGAVMKIPDGLGGKKIIVNADGTHATQMKCATEAVYLDHTTKIPITVEYYQGPRYHISLVAMWRPWPAAGSPDAVNDPYCGRSGNDLFFNSNANPVVPQTAFYELLSRNWKVLENENYFFPAQATNPCAPAEEPLAITGFGISGIGKNQVTLTWTTNINSSSQGSTKNITTSAVTLSAVDPTMVVNHSMTITGLTANTLYSVSAISASAGGQTAVSDERAFRTQR